MARRNPLYFRGASQYRGKEAIEFRPVTLSEIKMWDRDHFWTFGRDGKLYEVRPSGRVQTWKRDPGRVRLPFKYGMYENGAIDERDIAAGRMLVLV